MTATVTTPALPPPITVDKTVSKDGRGTVTTNAFSTAAPGELLVAYVGMDGPPSIGQTALVSGAGLTWTLIDRENTQSGVAEAWQAMATGVLSNVTVSSAVGVGTYNQSLTVVAYQGAAGIGNAVTANGAGAGSAPSATLNMVGFNSVVYAVGIDWSQAAARTLAPGQSMVHQDVDPAAGTFWVQALNGPAGPVETPITMASPTPAGDQWDFVAVEIMRPVSVAPVAPTISGVGTSAIGTTSATVTWATDQPSSSQVDYGLTTAYGTSTTLDSTAVSSHSQVLSGLTANTTYHFRVDSANGIGATSSGDFTFTTSSGKASQTITFGALATRTLAQSPLTVSATASSGLTVAFTTTTPTICTSGGTNGATITLLAVGTCTVKADQAGNGSFDPAPSVSRSFAVTSSASGAISVDKTVFVDGHGAQTTAPFSTIAPGELLVAYVAADGATSAVQSTTVSGAGLTWSLVRRANTQFGTAEIWSATASGVLTNATVTSTLTKQNFDQSMTVVAYQGAAGIGASVNASAAERRAIGRSDDDGGRLVGVRSRQRLDDRGRSHARLRPVVDPPVRRHGGRGHLLVPVVQRADADGRYPRHAVRSDPFGGSLEPGQRRDPPERHADGPGGVRGRDVGHRYDVGDGLVGDRSGIVESGPVRPDDVIRLVHDAGRDGGDIALPGARRSDRRSRPTTTRSPARTPTARRRRVTSASRRRRVRPTRRSPSAPCRLAPWPSRR